MSWLGVARRWLKNIQVAFDLVRDLLTWQDANPSGGHFDAEWHSLHQSANARYSGFVSVGQRKTGLRPVSVLYKQLYSTVVFKFETRFSCWKRKTSYVKHPLFSQLQPLTC